MTPEELKQHANWIQHNDVRELLASPGVPHPWFSAYRHQQSSEGITTWFSALVPIQYVRQGLKDANWDLHLGDGCPSIWTHSENNKASKRVYCPFGNEEGIEPLVIYRDFHGMQDHYFELSQEFCLYFNLYHDRAHNRFLNFNRDGNDSEAVRYGSDFFEIRTDLLLRFCTVKQMALGIFLDSTRYSPNTLQELGLEETRTHVTQDSFIYNVAFVPDSYLFDGTCETLGHLMGKKYILPDTLPTDEENGKPEVYQEFIIGNDENGHPIKFTSDPGKLANYFGLNPNAPNFLTPVFFRPDVLAKYYADPQKYSVEDGYLRCGSLWGLRMDNDHSDYVVAYLGDLGTDLSEPERSYWLSFNIPPDGRTISDTNFKRAFLARWTSPQKPDLVFKAEYGQFCHDFKKANGWDFFLPLHKDDEHFLTSLRLPASDNQAEFDEQLLALTKVLIDSLNQNEISKGLTTLEKGDQGIAKLEKYFAARCAVGYEPHVKFLRVLQDLRSKSAAHRKGSSYEKLIADLKLKDEGQQKVFAELLTSGNAFILFLSDLLIPQA